VRAAIADKQIEQEAAIARGVIQAPVDDYKETAST
jgi:hypothetical protein